MHSRANGLLMSLYNSLTALSHLKYSKNFWIMILRLGIAFFRSLLYASHDCVKDSGFSPGIAFSNGTNVIKTYSGRTLRSCTNLMALNVLHMYLLIFKKHSARGISLQRLYSLIVSPQFSMMDTHRSLFESGLFVPIWILPTTCRIAPRLW